MEKRAAILEAAKALFIRNAFAGTSMDAIAAEAGVSKLTVYSHFGDKDNLFREVIRARIQDLCRKKPIASIPTRILATSSIASPWSMHSCDCDPENVGTFRAILSDCRQGNPRYGKLMWEEGPMRTRGLMERLLQQAVDATSSISTTCRVPAMQFMSLIKGDMMMRRMFGCAECVQTYAQGNGRKRPRRRCDVPARLSPRHTEPTDSSSHPASWSNSALEAGVPTAVG